MRSQKVTGIFCNSSTRLLIGWIRLANGKSWRSPTATSFQEFSLFSRIINHSEERLRKSELAADAAYATNPSRRDSLILKGDKERRIARCELGGVSRGGPVRGVRPHVNRDPCGAYALHNEECLRPASVAELRPLPRFRSIRIECDDIRCHGNHGVLRRSCQASSWTAVRNRRLSVRRLLCLPVRADSRIAGIPCRIFVNCRSRGLTVCFRAVTR